MIGGFLIVFRETLEAALIVGIILGYLAKTKHKEYNRYVYWGVVAGLIGSVLSAVLFNVLAGGFSGRAEEIFEGLAMLIGATLLTTMILWMMNQKHVAHELKEKVRKDIKKKDRLGLFLLVFISVIREGVETVIFLGAASFLSGQNTLIGGVLGGAAALGLGYMLFVASKNVNIKQFFNISSILLLLFAAGLVAHGVHELQEAAVMPIIKEHIWDINPPAPRADEGIYPALHENGSLGSIAKGLFGYNGNPNLLEVLAYVIYLILVGILLHGIRKKQLSAKQLQHPKSL